MASSALAAIGTYLIIMMERSSLVINGLRV